MKLTKWHSLIFILGFLFTVIGLDLLTTKSPSNLLSTSKNWHDLVQESLNTSGHKNRNLLPQTTQGRKPSSETTDLILNNGKSSFLIQGNLVNIEKNLNHPPKNRLAAVNIHSGKVGYVSGEIIVTTSNDVVNSPIAFDGIEIKIIRKLSLNKFILGISPASELPRALDYLKAHFNIESIKVDIVDREIKTL